MKSRLLAQYIWLINTLRENGEMTFEDIDKAWQTNGPNGAGKGLPKRTFHDHRDAIEEVFSLKIACRPSPRGYVYYLQNPEVMAGAPMTDWLLKSYCVPKDFSTYKSMQDRILLEEIPKGSEYVERIIEAMRDNRELRLRYKPFNKDGSEEIQIQPYALKVYNRRWYVVGYVPERKGIRHLALDRVAPTDMVITRTRFKVKEDFDPHSFYANAVGVFVNPDLKPEKVVLRVYGNQIEYVRTLPIHSSQGEARAKIGEYCDFTYKLCITPELSIQILALGDNAEVLQPASLREEIKSRLERGVARYN